MKNKKKTKQIIMIDVILVFVAVLLVFVGYKVYGILSEYHEAEKEYEEIQDIAISEDETQEDGGDRTLKVDFERLSAINPEIVAWIHFDEPSVINYPVVQSEDNVKYLTTTFEGEENGAGCIYMDTDNAGDFTDKNTFIYGHDKKNGHMFGSLDKYRDEEYCKNHPFFDIYTPDGAKSRYQIFAVTVVDASSDSYRKVYVNEEEYRNYIQMIKKLALFETEVEVTEEMQIVSLSTCTNVRIEERLLIHGVKISQEQTK